MPADSSDAWVLEFKNVIVQLYSFVLLFHFMYIVFCLHGWLCESIRYPETGITDNCELPYMLGIEPWSLGIAVLLTNEPSLQPLLLKITICSHMYYTGISHIFKVWFRYYFLEHLRTNKALQSHNSTGMVLCKSFNINLENGEVLLLETYVVPLHSHLQMEL